MERVGLDIARRYLQAPVIPIHPYLETVIKAVATVYANLPDLSLWELAKLRTRSYTRASKLVMPMDTRMTTAAKRAAYADQFLNTRPRKIRITEDQKPNIVINNIPSLSALARSALPALGNRGIQRRSIQKRRRRTRRPRYRKRRSTYRKRRYRRRY